MAQSNTDSAHRGLDIHWAGPSQQPPVMWDEWVRSFQPIVIGKEQIGIENLLQDNILPDNPYLTLGEPPGIEDQQARTDREVRDAAAITAERDEENRWTEGERRTFKDSIPGDADKVIKSKLFPSLGKQGQKYFNQKRPYRKIVDLIFIELWKLSIDTVQKEPNVAHKRFLFLDQNKKTKRA